MADALHEEVSAAEEAVGKKEQELEGALERIEEVEAEAERAESFAEAEEEMEAVEMAAAAEAAEAVAAELGAAAAEAAVEVAMDMAAAAAEAATETAVAMAAAAAAAEAEAEAAVEMGAAAAEAAVEVVMAEAEAEKASMEQQQQTAVRQAEENLTGEGLQEGGGVVGNASPPSGERRASHSASLAAEREDEAGDDIAAVWLERGMAAATLQRQTEGGVGAVGGEGREFAWQARSERLFQHAVARRERY